MTPRTSVSKTTVSGGYSKVIDVSLPAVPGIDLDISHDETAPRTPVLRSHRKPGNLRGAALVSRKVTLFGMLRAELREAMADRGIE